jgi:hypothetical protein
MKTGFRVILEFMSQPYWYCEKALVYLEIKARLSDFHRNRNMMSFPPRIKCGINCSGNPGLMGFLDARGHDVVY